MSILGKLGLKKEKPVEKPQASEPKAQEKPRVAPVSARDSGRAYQILVRPVLSEKGTSLAASGKYVFVVHPKSNKSEIRKSIESVYDVHVREVKVLKMPSKARRYGRTVGYTSAFKKAIVSLRPGEKIAGIIEAVG